jgi:hypothetical protein
MHFRRLACLLLGIWFGGAVAVAIDASYGHRALAPGSLEQINAMGQEGTREFLVYAAAEQTRSLRETWDSVQVGLGIALLFVLLFGSREGKFGLSLALALLVLALLDRFVLTPQLAALAASGAGPADRTGFLMLEGGYMALEVAKWVAGMGLAAHMTLRRQHSSNHKAQVASL